MTITTLEVFVCCPSPNEMLGFCGIGVTAKDAQQDLSQILKANFREDQKGIIFSKTLKVKR